MKPWKPIFIYWLYSQSFFIVFCILSFISLFSLLLFGPFIKLIVKYSSYNFANDFLFLASLSINFVLLYYIFKSYWKKFIITSNYNFEKFSYLYIILLIITSIAFTFGQYINNYITTLIFPILPLINLSFLPLILLSKIETYFSFFAYLFIILNFVQFAFYIRYIYIFKKLKLPIFKFGILLLITWLSFSFIINYTLNNNNTIRSHNFAYENGLSSVDLKKYKITNPDNILPKLNEISTLQLAQEEWLRLDGAEAAYPVYSAYANACYDGIAKYQYNRNTLQWHEQDKINAEFEKYIAFNNTVYAFTDLINKNCDIFFGAMPSKQQQLEAAALGEELVLTPIAKEAFVFFVNSANPVDNLTTQQIKDIYNGKTKNWQPLGGDDRRILAFQRPEGSGSQTLLQHIMGDTPIMEPLKEEYIGDMGGIGTQVANYNGEAGALGFSFKFFLTGMLGRKDAPVKMLAIDGVYPTDENIRSGKYPFTTNLYAITLKSNTKPHLQSFLKWMQSPQGQEIAEKVGYVRIK